MGRTRGSYASRARHDQRPLPPQLTQQQSVSHLLRSGKSSLSLSESQQVANFLARQKDLLILCGHDVEKQ